jgi:hypothetical protein
MARALEEQDRHWRRRETARLMETLLQVAVLGGILTAIGWFVASFLRDRHDRLMRRQEARMKYLERQIQEFYGPLFNLTQQILVCNQVRFFLVEDPGSPVQLQEDTKERVRRFFQEQYFSKLHQEVNNVLKTKLHLVEGRDLPQSFYNYIRGSIQGQVQRVLWETLNIDTSSLRGIPWDNQFQRDIKQTLDSLLERYEQTLQGLLRPNYPQRQAGHATDGSPSSEATPA